MLEINLLPLREAKRRENVRQHVLQLVFGLLLTAASAGFVHTRLVSDVASAKRRVAQMDNDIKQYQPQLDQVAKFRTRKGELEKKIDVIAGLDRARSGPVRVLDELATRTPERLWLAKLDTKGSAVTLKGSSLDNEIVAHFLRALEESPYFQDVDLEGTKMGQKDELKLVEFAIHANLAGVAPPPDAKAAAAKQPKARKKPAAGGGEEA
jgi:type IV pilus assembly protein PilN